MRERFTITGNYKGCYHLCDIRDNGKRIGSVQKPDLNGTPYILDLLNQLNKENQTIKTEITRIINKKIEELENNPNVTLIPREATMVLNELKMEIKKL